MLILVGTLVALAFARSGALDALLAAVGRTEAAAFLAGVFFTSAFTLAPAAIALARIAMGAPFVDVALWGALGALCGDLIIFFFVRDRFADDLVHSFRPSLMRRIMASFHLGFMKWISPVLGALIIASPFPDELALALMGLSRTRLVILIPVSFAMNWLGIAGLVYLAHAF